MSQLRTTPIAPPSLGAIFFILNLATSYWPLAAISALSGPIFSDKLLITMTTSKNPIVQNEEATLKFWQENKIFEKSVQKDAPAGDYVFYDGPPFATGLPHYGHILSSVIKDVVPRYWTMKGYRVPRRWGWDCHGLPIENIVEKELKISGKKNIEEKIGVDKFNETCRSKVLTYTGEWKTMVDRIGRWIDFDNSYKTMDSTYMESVWWAVKTIWDKGLIYKGRKMLMYCPRCESPISKAEVAMDNSYKDVTEPALTLKFKMLDEPDTYLLAWTTTPWTLPAHMFIAVGPEIEYVKVKHNNEHYIVGKKLIAKIFTGQEYSIEQELSSKDLIGKKYEQLFPFYPKVENGLRVWEYENVSDEEGTGLVHMAAFGDQPELDFMNANNIELIVHLNPNGTFVENLGFLAGKNMKTAAKEIEEYLQREGKLFSKENYTHPYPHCWRCETPLYYNAMTAWFIDIQKIKPRLIELNEKINWYPEHLKHGRFLNILETAPDWNISRNRYWASPLPFWICDNSDCGEKVCLGSFTELKEKAINFNEVYQTDDIKQADIHKHLVDKIKLTCAKCGSTMTRIPEVIDCWVESGSMPFAEHHYPFANQEIFKRRFPGQYIAEYIAQTRAWFYYMHVISTLLFDEISFKNCVCTGTILNEKGEKLSKSKRNYIDPWEIINQYGVDTLRYYLMSSVVMQAENLFFSDKEVKEIYNKVLNILNNVESFYQMYADDNTPPTEKVNHVLDKWIYARLQQLIATVTKEMDNYNTVRATRPIKDFIDDLSTWYLRRSRDRFKGDDEEDKLEAITTLRRVLVLLAKIIAPFMPFIAEKIYLDLTANRAEAKGSAKESVHLETWPEVLPKFVNEKVLSEMELVKKIVEAGLAARAEAGIKIRQPLTSYSTSLTKKLTNEYLDIIKDELNISELKFGDDKLNIELTPELKEQGLVRELVRFINSLRKNAGLTIQDRVTVYYQTDDAGITNVFTKFAEQLKKDTLANDLQASKPDLPAEWQSEVRVNDASVWLGLKK